MKKLILVLAIVFTVFGCSPSDVTPTQKEWYRYENNFWYDKGKIKVFEYGNTYLHVRIVKDSLYMFDVYKDKPFLTYYYDVKNVRHRAKLGQTLPLENNEYYKGTREYTFYYSKDSLILREDFPLFYNEVDYTPTYTYFKSIK